MGPGSAAGQMQIALSISASLRPFLGVGTMHVWNAAGHQVDHLAQDEKSP
jgi:hypothetical protein